MVHVLDTRQLGIPGIIAATALETREGLVLFDTGPEATFEQIGGELRRVGAKIEDVRHVFLSHIHFDHAGAAWRFAETGATIYVHPRGATHLLDPTKLIESATRIFGSEMSRLWGKIAPVPSQNVRMLEDGDVVRVGEVDVRAIATPGHASHHHVYAWDDCLFGGDIAGVRIGGGPPIPPFVPPELHVEAWLESIDRMRALQATRLYLPHFGAVEDSIVAHFDVLEEHVRRWANWFRDQIQIGANEAHLVPLFARYEAEQLSAGGATKEDAQGYEAADPSHMAVTASLRYWRKYHPDAVGVRTS
ncbi:MAG: MBL fold metallo-hydrolase [Chthoniobacterales bacterium]